MEKLANIIQKLKAPKNQKNTFGGYNYRSCEDILEAVKPLLDGAVLKISDEIVIIGDRYYVKATVTFYDGDYSTSTTAYAREAEIKKGMDESQITGAASSYARKYALNGLFLIDDTKDADTMDNSEQNKSIPAKSLSGQAQKDINSAESINDLQSVYNAYATSEPIVLLREACAKRKKQIYELSPMI